MGKRIIIHIVSITNAIGGARRCCHTHIHTYASIQAFFPKSIIAPLNFSFFYSMKMNSQKIYSTIQILQVIKKCKKEQWIWLKQNNLTLNQNKSTFWEIFFFAFTFTVNFVSLFKFWIIFFDFFSFPFIWDT